MHAIIYTLFYTIIFDPRKDSFSFYNYLVSKSLTFSSEKLELDSFWKHMPRAQLCSACCRRKTLDVTRRQEGRAASGTGLQSEATLKTKVQRQLLKTVPLLYDSTLISQFPKPKERQINYLFLIEHTITLMFPQISPYSKNGPSTAGSNEVHQ